MRASIATLTLALARCLVGCSSSETEERAPLVLPATPADAGSTSDAAADAAPVDGSSIDGSDGGDASSDDGGQAAPNDGGDAGSDAGPNDACSVFGAAGVCLAVPTCAALGDHTSYAGHCSGPTTIECCIKTPSTTDNPAVPAGYKLMQQAQVTSEMTAWAVMILNDPMTYPMFDTVMKTFGSLMVLARVEWHPPDFQNGVVHRGVTLYVPG